jgi:HlyD family secretion protein
MRFIKPLFLTLLIISGAVAYFVLKDENTSRYDFIIAERGNVSDEVSVTGKVIPADEVDLAFEKTGRVSWVGVSVGDTVGGRQQLVRLQNSDINAEILEAKARLKAAETKLSELNRGTRAEEIQVQEIKVSNAETSLKDSNRALADTIKDTYTKSDDAIRNKIDQFFLNPRENDPQLDFVVKSSQIEIDVESGRVEMENLLTFWKPSIDEVSSVSDLDKYTFEAEQNLEDISSYLNDVALAVNDLDATADLTQATVDGYKADVSTARTNVNTAISNLSSSDKKRKDSISALALAKEELVLKNAGATTESIQAQEAKVEEARAAVDRLIAEIEKTVLHAPFPGVVSAVNAEEGEIVTAQKVVVSLISAGEFEIETYVPEIDIARLKEGDSASVTLDAYGGKEIFYADIIGIDPAETVIEGVSTYKTILQFKKPDEKIRSGMTANIDIVVGAKENVIVIPVRAVLEENGETFVRMYLGAESTKEIPVITGLRGSEGTVEIIDGVEEGDKVIIFVREE